MMKPEEAAKALRSMADAAWLEGIGERLSPIKGCRREMIACAIDSDRRERLTESKQSSRLPKALRSENLEHHQLLEVGASELGALGEKERRQPLARLVPGKEWAFEAGWRAVARKPALSAGEHSPFRAPGDPSFTPLAQGVWLCGALAEIGPYGSTSVAELAGWLSHMQTYGDEWPWLFAGAIDAGGTEGGKTLETLIDCVNGVHPKSQG